jgi:hypothetical protein
MCEGKRVGHMTNSYPFAFDEHANDVEAVRLRWPSVPVDPD